jgi:methionyl-tRNA formyltransferase
LVGTGGKLELMPSQQLVVLTTETPHHTRFVAELSKQRTVAAVFCETKIRSTPFPTSHPFEDRRETFEQEAWFGGRPARLAEFAPVIPCETANEPTAVAELRRIAPDAVIVFGTGLLKRPVLEVCGEKTVNLHGGDPEHYRGLDTHLWAIYHDDFDGLCTTLHTVNEELDDGQIIATLPLPIVRGMQLYELRKANTEVCLRLVLEATAVFVDRGAFVSRPQRTKGRYYSFMPAELKEICVQKFQRFTESR